MYPRQDLNFYNGQRVCLIWELAIHYNVLATSGILEPNLTWRQKNCNRPECAPHRTTPTLRRAAHPPILRRTRARATFPLLRILLGTRRSLRRFANHPN